MRYTVFGVKNDLFVEDESSIISLARTLARLNSIDGYKARIWDNQTRKFL